MGDANAHDPHTVCASVILALEAMKLARSGSVTKFRTEAFYLWHMVVFLLACRRYRMVCALMETNLPQIQPQSPLAPS